MKRGKGEVAAESHINGNKGGVKRDYGGWEM
jgi:hypothetical protein